MDKPSPAISALAEHQSRADAAHRDAERLESVTNRLSAARLVVFLAGAIAAFTAISQQNPLWAIGAVVCLAAFVGLVVLHLRRLSAHEFAQSKKGVHERHIRRMTHQWMTLPLAKEGPLRPGHAYARDIDLVGPGSLVQRIDVSHTVRGEATLLRWLGAPASDEVIAARQGAVQELSEHLDFRCAFEAAGALAAGDQKLDAEPFLAFTRRRGWVSSRAFLIPLAFALPVLLIGVWLASQTGLLPHWTWAPALALNVVTVLLTGRACHDAFDLIAARRGFAEAHQRMLAVVEGTTFKDSSLLTLRASLGREGLAASEVMQRLDRWAGLSDFRTQFPLHFFVNFFVLWDLHVLIGLERWNRRFGTTSASLFDGLGEFEALCSLATLRDIEPTSTFPEVGTEDFVAEGLEHPLLPTAHRVANDVRLAGRGSAMIVTGSNMAGKSTLLRSVGLNIALALCGGPVCAQRMRVPHVRLRASMRAEDSLQQGASYFHAELTKLRGVVDHADEAPPVFFLLDELLRGTNAHARHIGAKAIVTHLLDRDGMGLVATHDIALSKLESQRPHITNTHFTDVMEEDEMIFDYRLRDGVVRTSNALLLLKMAGIDVPADTSLGDAAPPSD